MIGAPGLPDDPRFSSNPGRTANRDKLKPILDLYPVTLKDIRIDEMDRKTDAPWPLVFDGATPDMEFLRLEESSSEAPFLSDWHEFFFGTATDDGKDLKVEVASPKPGQKAAEVTVKGVHLCCGACKKKASSLFSGSTVEFPGSGEIKISGNNLDKSEVLETLRKAGFNGTVQ